MQALLGELRIMVQELIREELAKLPLGTSGHKPPSEFLSTTDAARIAGVTQGTIRRWIREKRLERASAGRMIRISRVDLEMLMRPGKRLANRRVSQVGTPEARAAAELHAADLRRKKSLDPIGSAVAR
jgi:excisionase family DNA binding protein